MVFTPLGNTLDEMFKKNISLNKQIETSEIIEKSKIIFEDIFGIDLSKGIKPLFLKNRTLTVSCGSSAIAQEIRLNQSEIVEKINEKIGKKEVDRIRYLA